MRRFAAGLAALGVLAGCGGGGSSEPTVFPTGRALDTSALTGIGSGETLANQALGEVQTTNDLLSETASYLSASGRAVYTKTIGSVTATLTVTEVSRTKSTFTIVLDGTVGGNTFSHFLWAEGTSETGTKNSKVGTHQLTTWYALSGSGATRATGDNWIFGDSSVEGVVSFTGGKSTVFGRTAAGVWTFAVHTGAADSTPVLADATVNADKSGVARLLCPEASAPRVTLTWAADRSGEVCLFETSCGGTDRPCRSFAP